MGHIVSLNFHFIFFGISDTLENLNFRILYFLFQLEERERDAAREGERKVRGSDRPSSSRPSIQSSSSSKRARLEGPGGGGHASANNLDADEALDELNKCFWTDSYYAIKLSSASSSRVQCPIYEIYAHAIAISIK